MEECIEHFSHEHPLSFFQVDTDEDPKPHRCRICGLPILSTPSYTCSINANCNFFVHKPCSQLPEKFDHKLHKETLQLEESMLPSQATEPLPNFRYKCWDHSNCEFDLHPLVAQPVEIKSQHKSHESHPLVAFCQEIVSLCAGCGEEEKGFFFHCQVCNFWIHQDCTILPSVVKLRSHPHPFILAYSLPLMPSHSSPEEHNCSICERKWRLPNGGVYFCGDCYSLAHVACAKPIMETVIADTEILHLPDKEDTFPSLTICRFIERNPKNIKIENKIMTKYHQHPLILDDRCSNSNSSDENVVCDVCTQPINMMSFPFYRCLDCDFLAHPMCANLVPESFETFLGPERLEALLHGDHMESHFNSVIPCSTCWRPSNGFSYKLIRPNGRFILMDVECAFTPKLVRHASHKQHLLFFTGGRWISEPNFKINCCSATSSIYRCVVCDYSIHVGCALLPKTTPHEFDDHPLELIMNHNNKLQDLFCEVCEQDIELKYWYYGCRKCEQYFHINCIPSVGYLSKVNFGKTHSNYGLHQHPLTLTRMLTHQRNERCGLCHQIIEGFSYDEIALHCSPCYYWLHFSCAASITGLIDYSTVIQGWDEYG